MVTVERRQSDGVTILAVAGRMTGLDEPGTMKGRVLEALAAGDRQLVLNLARLSFVDSSFIGELVACCLAASKVGGTVKLASPVRRVQELLYITHLATMVESHETEQGAVDSFATVGH